MRNKRGQLTIFIVIGLVILFLAGFAMIIGSNVSKIKREPTLNIRFDSDAITFYVEACIKSVIEDAIIEMGLCDETQLEQYLNTNLQACTAGFTVFEPTQVIEDAVNSNMQISENYDQVVIEVEYPLTLKKTKYEVDLRDFFIEYIVANNKVPTLSLGSEEIAGIDGNVRPSIDADRDNQPHIVVNYGNLCNVGLYHKINGVWSGGRLAHCSEFHPDTHQLHNPKIDIDEWDRGWVSAGAIFPSGSYDASGIMVFIIHNISTNPTKGVIATLPMSSYNLGFQGNLAVDPLNHEQAIVMGRDGYWVRVDDDRRILEQGQIFSGSRLSGEKIKFDISRCGIWHAAFGGWSPVSSSYQNSERKADGEAATVWAEYSRYPAQGDDHMHPAIGTDFLNPRAAYITMGYTQASAWAHGTVAAEGALINIWDGDEMVFPNTDLGVIDPSTTLYGNAVEGIRGRFGPQFAPSHKGGTFVCWTSSSNEVKIRYVASDGTMGPVTNSGPGVNCAIATDSEGDLHLTYIDESLSGVRYKKIDVDYQ